MRTRAVPGPVIVAALVPAALVLTHDLIFLLLYGSSYAAALAATGHDPHWEAAVRVVVGLSALLGLMGFVQLLRLGLKARSLECRAAQAGPGGWTLAGQATPVGRLPVGYRLAVLRTWSLLLPAVASLLVVQENLERYGAREPLPGLGVLAADGGLAAVIVTAVTFVVAAVGALFLWERARLVARIAAAAATRPRASQQPARHRRPLRLAPPSSLLGRNQAGRAPPLALR